MSLSLPLPGGKPSGSAHPSHPHGVLGLLSNLGADVGNAVKGVPNGIVQLAEHPVRGVEDMGKQTWHDWSPLVHGHVGQWARQTYDHPLAPLLDAATVFTGGASLAGKAAVKLGESGAVDAATAARLTKFGSKAKIGYKDPLAKDGEIARPEMIRHTSANPLKRAVQQKAADFANSHSDHLPHWFTPAGSYERLHLKAMMGRHGARVRSEMDAVNAYNAHLHAAMQAGKTLTHAESEITPVLLAHNYWNLRQHAFEIDPFERNSAGHVVKDANGKPVFKQLPGHYRYVVENKGQGLFDYKPGQKLENRLRDIGNTFTTPRSEEAALTKGGQRALIVPKHDATNLGREGANSSVFLKRAYRYPTRLWKMAFVGLSPKMVVNNAVGNYTMYAMRQAGHHSIAGIYDAIRQTRGLRVANKTADGAVKQYLSPHWMEKHFKDELGQSMFGATMGEVDKHGFPIATPKEGFRHSGFYGAVHHIADQPVRRAAINAYLRGAPEVKALMKKGSSFDQATAKALEGQSGKSLRMQAAEHAKDIAGDYYTLSQKEQLLKDFVPFYLWDRHILRHARNLATEHPGRIAMLQRLSHYGLAQSADKLGNVPDFLAGGIPMGQTSNGREKVGLPKSLNPYSSLGDLADAFAALTTGTQKGSAGETLGSELNPTLTAGIEGLTGHTIGSDASVPKHGGALTTALVNMALSAPEVKIPQTLISGTPHPVSKRTGKPKDTVYQHSLDELLSSYLGYPVKDVSPTAATKLYNKQEGIKTGRKHGHGPSVPLP